MPEEVQGERRGLKCPSWAQKVPFKDRSAAKRWTTHYQCHGLRELDPWSTEHDALRVADWLSETLEITCEERIEAEKRIEATLERSLSELPTPDAEEEAAFAAGGICSIHKSMQFSLHSHASRCKYMLQQNATSIVVPHSVFAGDVDITSTMVTANAKMLPKEAIVIRMGHKDPGYISLAPSVYHFVAHPDDLSQQLLSLWMSARLGKWSYSGIYVPSVTYKGSLVYGDQTLRQLGVVDGDEFDHKRESWF